MYVGAEALPLALLTYPLPVTFAPMMSFEQEMLEPEVVTVHPHQVFTQKFTDICYGH